MLLCLGSANASMLVAQEGANEQIQWTEFARSLRRAGELFREEKFEESAALVREVAAKIPSMPKSDDPTTTVMRTKVQKGVQKARELLGAHGITIEDSPVKAPKAGTSFVKDVVPILMAKCGNCHVRENRGEVSLATFDALTLPNGTTPALVQANASAESELIRVIESGEMPKGRGKVSAKQLAILKAWIDEGATSDMPDPAATIDTL